VTSPAPSSPPVPLRRNRDFRRLWCGQVASELGANNLQLAVPLLVLSITGSASWAGAITTIGAGVAALSRLPGGALADRWNRRRLMLASDAGRLVACLILGICVLLSHVPVLLVTVVVCSTAILDVLFAPAETAAVSRLVPPGQLAEAFAGNQARTFAASLGGRPLGGVLYGLGRAVPFLAAAAGYLVSLTLIAAIREPLQDERPRSGGQSLAADIRDGVRLVFTNPFLRAVVLIAAPLNFALSGAIFITTIALRQSGNSPAVIGLALSAFGGAGLLGAGAAAWLNHRLPLRHLIAGICAGQSVAAVAAAALSGRPTMVLPLAAGLFLGPAVNTALYARLGATVPDHAQARVISVVMLAATGAAALSPLVGGLLITAGSAAIALLGCAAMLGVALVIAVRATGAQDPQYRS